LATSDAAAFRDGEVRAGSHLLSLFANPLNTRILRVHLDGPMRLSELHERIGWSAHTTLRAAVTNLRKVGALEKGGGENRPLAPTTLTPAGEEMLLVAGAVERWLALCPAGPIAPDSDAAKSVTKALAGGWSSTLMRALASQPFTLTELNSLIPEINYPSLERRVARMRVAGQIEPVEGAERGKPYVVTDWLRRGIAPLAVAGRCERRYLPDVTAPITEVEVETAFMLTIPLASLPPATGACMLAVPTGTDESQERGKGLAGVMVEVERGEVVSCAARLKQDPPTWALGTTEAWLDVMIDGRIEELRFGGVRPQLAADLVNGVHFALFGEQP